ncbi:cryptochrome/photolyase family protein [Nitrospira moscoviensis]|uniref:Deoxyribodipyrimidine photo-lyase n=1 Tax=Nitrospira moscoviensis TaxID=42253 RepID=A0A0K2G6U9_NITMO|nr:deoxyribodipyrimidine photo-lyase [Nitrospira moscoviensis]ALA56584.1 Deoxyribodipyrimidine photo-lyase [Nitrospira moscoviensis]
MHGIVWFRRDLRLSDQPALTAACKECRQVIPLFVFDEPLLQSQVFGSACVNFMLGCLEDLAESLAARGLPLQWRRGEPVEEVVSAAREWKIDVVYWNRDYEPRALERDRLVQQRLAQMGVLVRTFKDHVVFEAEEVRSATGEPLQRYSAYRARWWAKWQATKPPVLPVPSGCSGDKAVPLSPPRPIPTAHELGYEPLTPWIEAGERQARKRLSRFVAGPIHTYVDGRNRPAIDGSSKLSPHFRFGTLSPRTAVHAALAALAQGGRVSRPDVLTWIDELVWREFFQQVLSAFPRVVDGPFRSLAVPPPRQPGLERDRLFQAWCDGRTGYPIVDAGMRQLKLTGWMHNRVRMIVASFLIKDLRIDWQSGERYFMKQLLDADVAANNGNWQWCASTGTDAMRGYRIFNPVLQSKTFDPQGDYIRRYVPALAKVPAPAIHEPHLMTDGEQRRLGSRIGLDYPAPIVDHRQARLEYLALGKAAQR